MPAPPRAPTPDGEALFPFQSRTATPGRPAAPPRARGPTPTGRAQTIATASGMSTEPRVDHLQRTVLNAILLDRDPGAVRCGPTCNGRSPQACDGHLRPGESLAPRICPHVALALVWLRHQGLITVDDRGVRPTSLARPPKRIA